MINIAVLISGGGTNLQAIINACESGILAGKAHIRLVISSRSDAYGLERAHKHNIEAFCVSPREFSTREAYCQRMIDEITLRDIGLICLAGYMLKLEPNFVKAFPKRILNIHPALLPKHGGKGMYGHFVHEAVIEAGDHESGATVHWVDEEYDHGAIVIQETVPVVPGDNADILAARVLEVEHKIYPKAILKVIESRV